MTPNVFRGNLQLEAHKAGILATPEEKKKSPCTPSHTRIHGGVSGQLILPAFSPLILPFLMDTGFGVLALPRTCERVSLHRPQTKQVRELPLGKS